MSAPKKRWPWPPPKDARCDAHVRLTIPEYGAPLTIPEYGAPSPVRCENMADETVLFTQGVVREGWFCQDCIPALLAKGLIVRNPRKFPVPSLPESNS